MVNSTAEQFADWVKAGREAASGVEEGDVGLKIAGTEGIPLTGARPPAAENIRGFMNRHPIAKCLNCAASDIPSLNANANLPLSRVQFRPRVLSARREHHKSGFRGRDDLIDDFVSGLQAGHESSRMIDGQVHVANN